MIIDKGKGKQQSTFIYIYNSIQIACRYNICWCFGVLGNIPCVHNDKKVFTFSQTYQRNSHVEYYDERVWIIRTNCLDL